MIGRAARRNGLQTRTGVRKRVVARECPGRGAAVATEAAPRGTVLVVEDDEAISELLVLLLREHEYDSRPAHDGRSAIRLARQLKPDLITLDLALPGLDGQSVLKRLRIDPETREIPVIVISSFTQVVPSGDRRKVAYMIGKPFDVSEVMSIVEATVGNPY